MTWGHEEETQNFYFFSQFTLFFHLYFVAIFLWHQTKLFPCAKKLFLNLFFIQSKKNNIYFMTLSSSNFSMSYNFYHLFIYVTMDFKKHYPVILLFIWLSYDDAQISHTLYTHTTAINFHQKYHHFVNLFIDNLSLDILVINYAFNDSNYIIFFLPLSSSFLSSHSLLWTFYIIHGAV
jgi:hypothetical protein